MKSNTRRMPRLAAFTVAVAVVGGLFTGPAAFAAPAPVPNPREPFRQQCDSRYINWAELRIYRNNKVRMSLEPNFPWGWSGGHHTAHAMWADYFECIGSRYWFNRLTADQQDSLWYQHFCHASLGGWGRVGSGPTFDYESWKPNRGSLANAIAHKCN